MATFCIRDGIANRLLLSLPRTTLNRLRSSLELVDLPKGDVVDQAHRRVEHLYFVNRGLVSLVKTMQDGRTVEIGVVGIEGVTAPHALFGLYASPLEAIVQVPGTAFRAGREVLKRNMAEDDTLRETLEKYSNFSILAIAQTAACNRLHPLEERCCRWLLIAHDSALSNTFPLTQDFLAMMLGVQRAGVSVAANSLKRSGLIRYSRGQVTITNRSGLEDAACECYRDMQAEFDKLLRIGP